MSLEECPGHHPEQKYHFKGTEEEYEKYHDKVQYSAHDLGRPLQVLYHASGAWIYAHNPEGWGEGAVEIIFCPWCGKKLADGKKKEEETH